MPKFLEEKLKRQYGANSDIPYRVMNSIGAMHGNKETPKGAAMAAKHAADSADNMASGDNDPLRKFVKMRRGVRRLRGLKVGQG